MAYASKADQARKSREHYERNAEKMKARAREHTKRQRLMLRELLRDLKARTPCADCGRHYPPYVMDFDHVCGEQKYDNLADMAKDGVSLKRLMDEVAKCDIVCANCHRERTHGGEAADSIDDAS